MKIGKILVSIYQPGSAAILNSIPGLEVIEGLAAYNHFFTNRDKLIGWVGYRLCCHYLTMEKMTS